MLCITMRRGDYFTIGENIVIQCEQLSGERAHVTIDAPRELPIVRGKVLERTGGQRPGCVYSVTKQTNEVSPGPRPVEI